MAYGKGKITAPVEIQDPYAALGVGRPSGGYDLGSLIEQHHDRINRWARYKPVCHTDIFASVPGNKHYPGWWKAAYTSQTEEHADGNCGLMPRTTGGGGARLDFIRRAVTDRGWDYLYPKGGASEAYRLSDWAGYDHEALCPFGEIRDSRVIFHENASQCSFTIYWAETLRGEGALDASDIRIALNDATSETGLDGWYYGVILYGTDLREHAFLLTARTPGSRIIQVSGFYTDNLFDDFHALPFMCNRRLEPNGAFHSDELYIALPQEEPAVIEFVSYDDLVTVVVHGVRDADDRDLVGWTVSFINNSTSPVTFRNTSLYAKTGSGPSGRFLAYYDGKQENSVTVPGRLEGDERRIRDGAVDRGTRRLPRLWLPQRGHNASRRHGRRRRVPAVAAAGAGHPAVNGYGNRQKQKTKRKTMEQSKDRDRYIRWDGTATFDNVRPHDGRDLLTAGDAGQVVTSTLCRRPVVDILVRGGISARSGIHATDRADIVSCPEGLLGQLYDISRAAVFEGDISVDSFTASGLVVATGPISIQNG